MNVCFLDGVLARLFGLSERGHASLPSLRFRGGDEVPLHRASQTLLRIGRIRISHFIVNLNALIHHSKVTEWCVSSRGGERRRGREMPRGVSLISNEIESRVTSLTSFLKQLPGYYWKAVKGLVGSISSLISPQLTDVRSLSHCWSPADLWCCLYPASSPLWLLCYWVRWIYQGRRVGQFTHRGDNYRVIGFLMLSALTIFVSSLLALSSHKRTQHAMALEVDQKGCSVPGSRPSYLLDLRGPVLNSCVCLIENMCTIVYRCLWIYLHQRIDWSSGDSRL